MVLSAWAWAEVPGRGRRLVCAVVHADGRLRLAMTAMERQEAGVDGALTGELVTAEGRRLAAAVTAEGRLDVSTHPQHGEQLLAHGARFESVPWSP